MKKNIIILITGIIAALSFYGCRQDEGTIDSIQETFSKEENYGVYMNGKETVCFDRYNYQISRNTTGTLFRIQSDNLSKVAECRFSADPTTQKEIETTITFTGAGTENINDTFTCIRNENGKCWLWNAKLKCGIIMPASR